MATDTKINGFTLLEMAIVLIVIGLIAGGIITSQSLIRQANIRAIISEYDMYTKSIKEFQDKFLSMPGDLSTATTLWGAASTCPLPGNGAVSHVPATCNGDGDGKIGDCSGALNCNDTAEPWLVWQHLNNAGLIEKRVTGSSASASIAYRANVGSTNPNVPSSARKPGGWSFLFYLNPTTAAYLYGDQYGHIFLYGGDKGGNDGKYTTAPILYVDEAYSIDKKIDDGLPRSGMIRAWENYWRSTSESAVSAGADGSYCIDTAIATAAAQYYAYPDKKENVCSLLFIPGL